METQNTAPISSPEPTGGLTPEKLRQFPGLEGLDDAQAMEIILDLAELSRLLYQISATCKNIIQ